MSIFNKEVQERNLTIDYETVTPEALKVLDEARQELWGEICSRPDNKRLNDILDNEYL